MLDWWPSTIVVVGALALVFLLAFRSTTDGRNRILSSTPAERLLMIAVVIVGLYLLSGLRAR